MHSHHLTGSGRRLRAIAAGVAVAAVISACSGDATSSDTTVALPPSTVAPATTSTSTTTTAAPATTLESTTTVEATTTTEAATTTTVPAVPVYPLTGVAVSDPAVAARQALVVKIDNAPAARPQTGFNAADVVYEEIVNDNLTRFALVFHSGDSDPVGPIRSGRLQDIDLFGSYRHPLFAWSGGNRTVTDAIRASDLVDIGPSRAAVYFRSGGRRAPYNLYSSTSALWSRTTEDAAPPPQHFQYRGDGAPVQGSPSMGVDVVLDSINVAWRWNAETALYERIMEGRTHTDAASGQVTTNNVVVLATQYVPGISGSPDAQTVGDGEAFVFTGGNFVHGTWTRVDRLQPAVLTADDGTPISLTPGRTFIELPRAFPGTIAPQPPA